MKANTRNNYSDSSAHSSLFKKFGFLLLVTTLVAYHSSFASSNNVLEENTAMLSWDGDTESVHHYVLEISENSFENTSDPIHSLAYTDHNTYSIMLMDNTAYSVKVRAVDAHGNTSAYSDNISFSVLDNQVVEKTSLADTLPETFALYQNHPNPFNPTTTIQFDIPVDNHVKLTVYNITGQKVSELVDDTIPAGSHSIRWDAHDMPSGVYFYKILTESMQVTKKMMLIK